METELIKINSIDDEALKRAGQCIKDGGLVAFPTETVYGLGGDGLNEVAAKNIYLAKGRPSDNPLILHINDQKMLSRIVSEVTPMAKKIMTAFCPGPITIILPKSDIVPKAVTGGLDTIAVRMPDNDIARALIKYADTPIAAPSANISGRPSPTTAQAVYKDLQSRIDMVLDGGACQFGVESTIVDCTEDVPIILRPGAITKEMLEEIFSVVKIDKAIVGANVVPKAPGMKYKHYSPNAHVIIVKGDFDKFASLVAEPRSERTCAVCFDGEEDKISVPAYPYGHADSPEEQARELFDVLRHVDDEKMELAFVRFPSLDGVGMAVYNRLLRAAGFEVIEL